MTKKRNVWAVVPAAGVGRRMGTALPKQYQTVSGLPLLHHTLSRLCSSPVITGVVVGINRNDDAWRSNPFVHAKMMGEYAGGNERADTVLAGLHFLSETVGASDSDWALVHDAARPCVLQQDIANLLEAAEASQRGAVLGSILSDTLKKTDESSQVDTTVDREGLWRAFTPQVFPLGDLGKALENACQQGLAITDESMAMEQIGVQATMVQGHNSNIKITVPADLDLAELYLREFQ
jgi:2-C-methyl-D-erythritol 4-phosphate cytidylyltransferase